MRFSRSAAATVGLPGVVLLLLSATFARLSFYDETNRLVYALEPQKAASPHLEVMDSAEGPNLHVDVEQSDPRGVPGSRITLAAEVTLGPEMHVYAPGAKGYKPIQLLIDPMPEMEFSEPVYPQSRIMYFPVLEEHVPVFDGTFRISQDVKISTSAKFWGSLGKDGRNFTITGRLEYQACNTTTCYQPATIPLKWQLQVLPLDRNRAPSEIRHK